jgi:hypothetical protein
MRRLLPLLAALALATPAFAQTPYKAPRNAFGQPDLSGVWTNAALTSLERPAQFKTATITEAQAEAVEAARARAMDAQSRPTDPNAPAPSAGDDPGAKCAPPGWWIPPTVAYPTARRAGTSIRLP